jgi:hypothetical protein
MTLLKKIQYVFNKILLNLLKEIKNKDDALKKKIKENYAVFDKSTNVHVLFFIDNIEDPDLFTTPYESSNLLTNDKILNFQLLKNITVQDILGVIENSENEVIKCYLYILYMLSYIYKKAMVLEEEDDNTNDLLQLNELFNKCLKMIKKESDLSLDDEIDNVFDEDLCALFKNIFESRNHINRSIMNDDLDVDEDDPMSFLKNSKIGKLAQEITQDIDLQDLNIKDPSDLLNMESLMSGENSALGDIISKVGNKVASKISSGELKHEDLLSEAMAMMGKLNGGGGNNAFMEEMMKSAANMHMGNNGPNLKPKQKNKRKIKH